jgi:hypothetical protein
VLPYADVKKEKQAARAGKKQAEDDELVSQLLASVWEGGGELTAN